ncbi:hypothetical protein CCMA1212_002300 [Trichoderma ghanense]|uniref:Uncharacterized protein n=1 Tax=Trichoderma ghanense TaxID=65468 RepID=A0ABY2HCH1_9HYPO
MDSVHDGRLGGTAKYAHKLETGQRWKHPRHRPRAYNLDVNAKANLQLLLTCEYNEVPCSNDRDEHPCILQSIHNTQFSRLSNGIPFRSRKNGRALLQLGREAADTICKSCPECSPSGTMRNLQNAVFLARKRIVKASLSPLTSWCHPTGDRSNRTKWKVGAIPTTASDPIFRRGAVTAGSRSNGGRDGRVLGEPKDRGPGGARQVFCTRQYKHGTVLGFELARDPSRRWRGPIRTAGRPCPGKGSGDRRKGRQSASAIQGRSHCNGDTTAEPMIGEIEQLSSTDCMAADLLGRPEKVPSNPEGTSGHGSSTPRYASTSRYRPCYGAGNTLLHSSRGYSAESEFVAFAGPFAWILRGSVRSRECDYYARRMERIVESLAMDPADGQGTLANSLLCGASQLGRNKRLCRTQNAKAVLGLDDTDGELDMPTAQHDTPRHLQGVTYMVLGSLTLLVCRRGRTSPDQRPARRFGFCPVACTRLAPGNSLHGSGAECGARVIGCSRYWHCEDEQGLESIFRDCDKPSRISLRRTSGSSGEKRRAQKREDHGQRPDEGEGNNDKRHQNIKTCRKAPVLPSSRRPI